jgi:hypothetical protein
MVTIKNIWIERGIGGGGGWSPTYIPTGHQLEVEPWIRGYRLKFGQVTTMEENEFDNLAMDIAGYIRHRILEVKRDKPVEQQPQIEEAAPKIVDPEATRKEVVKTKKTKTKETP